MTFRSGAIQFPSAGQPQLLLEGWLHLPLEQGPHPAAIIAHPHPLWGGSMDTAVVRWIANTLAERGCAALRFNFRGVGGSQGHYDEGRGEIDDMVGALDALSRVSGESGIDTERLAVIGYSFGAWIAGQAVTRDERIRAYAAIALPMDQAYCVDLGAFRGPKTFITGAQDTISPPEPLRKFVGSLPEPKTLTVIPGTDHFLRGHEQGIADHVTDFLLSALNNPTITEKQQSSARGLASQGGADG